MDIGTNRYERTNTRLLINYSAERKKSYKFLKLFKKGDNRCSLDSFNTAHAFDFSRKSW